MGLSAVAEMFGHDRMHCRMRRKSKNKQRERAWSSKETGKTHVNPLTGGASRSVMSVNYLGAAPRERQRFR